MSKENDKTNEERQTIALEGINESLKDIASGVSLIGMFIVIGVLFKKMA